MEASRAAGCRAACLPGCSVRQEVPDAQSGLLPPVCKSPAAESRRKAASHRKTGPARVRFKFVGAGADYHLPEGNTADVSIAIWEDRQPIASSNKWNMAADMSRNNQEARMPAMRTSQEVQSMNFCHKHGIKSGY